VSNASQSLGAGIIEYPCKDLPEQKFLLTNVGAGDFTLRPSHSGQCVDIPGSRAPPSSPERR
jgi:rhamnogalacturonan endolyase